MAFINGNTIGEIPSLDMTQVGGTYSVPATPDAGQIQFYFKTDTLPYYKTPAGTEILIASGGGSGSAVFSDTAFKLQDDGDVAKQMQFQLSGITTGNTRVLTVPDFNGTLATLAGTETFTNKTLTSPTINTATIAGGTINNVTVGVTTPVAGYFSDLREKIGGFYGTFTHANSADRTYTLPNFNGTLATLAGTETFTNKTLTNPVISGGTIDNAPVGATTAVAGYFSDLREKIGGFFAIFTHANSADRTYTLPNYTATLATIAGTETFTNKTLTSPIVSGGTINNAVIGGTTPAAGTFTAVTVTNSGGTLLTVEGISAAADSVFDTYISSTASSSAIFRKSRGTKGSESAVILGDTLGQFTFRGWNGTTFSGNAATFTVTAAETFSTSAAGTAFGVTLTQPGTVSTYTALTVTNTIFRFTLIDATTGTRGPFAFDHLTTGVPAAGFGVDLFLESHSSTNTLQIQALIRAEWTVATDASRRAQLDFYVYDTAARLALVLGTSGSAATIGFFGAAQIVQPVNTVAIDTALTNLGLRASGGVALFDTDLKVNVVGKGIYVKEGTNATSGVATMSLGSVTVSTTKVTATSRIYLSAQGTGTSTGYVKVSARVNGTSFTITGGATDTDTVAWILIEPA